MKHDGSAAIVNIGSIAGEMGTNGMYSAIKFGIRGLSDSLRRELWTKHIAVSLIEPGYIRTVMTANVQGSLPGPERIARMLSKYSNIHVVQWLSLAPGASCFSSSVSFRPLRIEYSAVNKDKRESIFQKRQREMPRSEQRVRSGYLGSGHLCSEAFQRSFQNGYT